MQSNPQAQKEIQNYEAYWKLTNAFTDYNGKKFLDTLSVCIRFIQQFSDEPYSDEKYLRLQAAVHGVNSINYISIRKSINQLVKMGFLNTFLVSYHPLANDYLAAKTNKKRTTLLSKIVYSNASLNRSVNNDSALKQINFLIQTLIEKGSLSKDEIVALMLVDIEAHPQTFVTELELIHLVERSKQIGFFGRKYNQISHFCNLLGKLDNLSFVKDDLYFTEDAERIFGERFNTSTAKKRDPYLHRLYKNQLKAESEELFGAAVCAVELLDYPVLIASHIKPFVVCNEEEAYDPNNGLLLSRTLDSLFDLNYISFTDAGEILFSPRLSSNVKTFLQEQGYRLNPAVLNHQRKQYLQYHRNLME